MSALPPAPVFRPSSAATLLTSLILGVGLLSTVGCPGTDDTADSDTDTTTTQASPWEPLLEDLPGVLLSVWGTSSTDLWTTGAAKGANGPEVRHWDGSSWTQLDAGVETDLWWVFGASEDVVWFSGAEGTLIRHDRASGAFEVLETSTEATLYGTWGPSDDLVYSVGGFVDGSADDAGVILVTEDGVVSQVDDLPVGIDPDEVFFKVWGSSASDVWVIGTLGSVLHTDGSGTWTRTALPDSPRLVTLNGSGEDDIVVVGGEYSPKIFQRIGAAWSDLSPTGGTPLNGVYVTPSGQAVAVGMSGSVMERVGEAWVSVTPAPIVAHWHGVWIDELGAAYVAGGAFFDLEDGALYRYTAPGR